MKNSTEKDLVEVFAGSIFQAGLVKSLLEDAEIMAFFKDEITGTLAPFYASPGGAGSVRVVVAVGDYEMARLIVERYYDNIGSDQ